MVIRQYTKKDFKGLTKVIKSVQSEECWPHYYPNGWNKARIQEEFKPLNNYIDPIFLVSDLGGQITGLIAGHDLDSFIDCELPHLKNRFNDLNLFKKRSFYQRL